MVARLPAVGLALLIVLAGCSAVPVTEDTRTTGTAGPTTDASTTVATDSPPTTDTVETATRSDNRTPTVSGPPYDDPWPGSPTVVAINATATDRPVAGLVADALAYWEANDERYGNYTTTFDLRPNATDPDVVVQFVTTVETCGYHNDTAFVGCAPVLSNRALADRPTTIQIETGFTNDSTQRVIEHELGHVFGLGHGDPPESLMRAHTANLTRLPEPDVGDRTLTWGKSNLTVFVDRTALPGSAAEIDRQIEAALSYYDDAADESIPTELSLIEIDDREAADIVVTAAALDVQSNASTYGIDTDADPALEYFTNQTIVVDRALDPETLGWHVGFWLGDSILAPETPAELPPPFDDPRTDPRQEWWPDAN